MILLGLAAILILTGLGPDLFPALVLSRFEPVKTIRGRITSSRGGGALRKSLVIVQFGIAVVMIISILVVVRQVRFLQTKELGFNKDMMVIVPGRGQQNDALKNEILANSSVRGVSFDSDHSRPIRRRRHLHPGREHPGRIHPRLLLPSRL